jgi:rhamnulokinase
MVSKNYLIVDFGASNGRALVASYDGRKYRMKEVHRFDNRPVLANDTLYWDILRLFSELKISTMKALDSYKNISSLAVDSWGCDFGLTDRAGKLISNPVHYRDRRRHEIVPEVFKVIPQRDLFELTGGPLVSIMGVNGLFQMFAFMHDKTLEFLNAHRFLMIPDILNYYLTGITANEFTDATMSLMYNQLEKKWENSIFKRLGIPEHIFSEVLMPGNMIGVIQKSVTRELQIKPVNVVVPATHDTASAVAGIPVGVKDKTWAFISIGTWYICGVETGSPIINDAIFESGYANEGGVEGSNIIAKTQTGMWLIQKCRERWSNESGKDISWDEIIALSKEAAPFVSFVDVGNPLFVQAQLDMPDRIREFCERSGQKVPQSRGEIARCIYESLVMSFRFSLEVLEDLIGKKIDILHLVGGGAKNRPLCQWTADIMGIPVVAGPAETTSAGNLIMQLKGTGEIGSLQEGRQVVLNSSEIEQFEPRDEDTWHEAYARYLKLVHSSD